MVDTTWLYCMIVHPRSPCFGPTTYSSFSQTSPDDLYSPNLHTRTAPAHSSPRVLKPFLCWRSPLSVSRIMARATSLSSARGKCLSVANMPITVRKLKSSPLWVGRNGGGKYLGGEEEEEGQVSIPLVGEGKNLFL